MAIEEHSPTWRAVKAFAEREIADAHEQLETTGLGIAETENVRGRIAALRDLLGLTAPPRPKSKPETYGI